MVIDGRLHDQIAAGRHKKTGRNATDRGKQGVKRSLMTGANGLPLSVAGANTHDIKLVADTPMPSRPEKRAKTYASVWIKATKPNGWSRI